MQRRKTELAEIKPQLFALFSISDPWKRGKALELVMARLFAAHGLLVREALEVKGHAGEGVVEQVDGMVEIDGDLYLVETKWWSQPIGKPEVSQLLVGVYHRGQTRGIFIAYPGFTDAAVAVCREALQRTVVVLCGMEELVRAVYGDVDLKEFFKDKIRAAQMHKNPLAAV